MFSGDKNEIINEKLKKIGKEKLEMICNNLSIIILNPPYSPFFNLHQHYFINMRKNLKNKILFKKDIYSADILSTQLLSEFDAYIFCFSSEEDSLSLWRAYTPCEGGYALGFSVKKLIMKMNDKESENNLKEVNTEDNPISEDTEIVVCIQEESVLCYGRCIYIDKSMSELDMKLIRDKYNMICDRLIKNNNNDNSIKIGNSTMQIDDLAKLIMSSLIKDNSFNAENEVRLIKIMSRNKAGEIEFIAGKPRTKIFLDNVMECVDCICISPHGDKERHMNTADIIRAINDNKISIKESSSSYNAR